MVPPARPSLSGAEPLLLNPHKPLLPNLPGTFLLSTAASILLSHLQCSSGRASNSCRIVHLSGCLFSIGAECLTCCNDLFCRISPLLLAASSPFTPIPNPCVLSLLYPLSNIKSGFIYTNMKLFNRWGFLTRIPHSCQPTLPPLFCLHLENQDYFPYPKEKLLLLSQQLPALHRTRSFSPHLNANSQRILAHE